MALYYAEVSPLPSLSFISKFPGFLNLKLATLVRAGPRNPPSKAKLELPFYSPKLKFRILLLPSGGIH